MCAVEWMECEENENEWFSMITQCIQLFYFSPPPPPAVRSLAHSCLCFWLTIVNKYIAVWWNTSRTCHYCLSVCSIDCSRLTAFRCFYHHHSYAVCIIHKICFIGFIVHMRIANRQVTHSFCQYLTVFAVREAQGQRNQNFFICFKKKNLISEWLVSVPVIKFHVQFFSLE